jgi:hypothetical protein
MNTVWSQSLMGVVVATLGSTGCSSATTTLSSPPVSSSMPEHAPFPNDRSEIDTATSQLAFTDYAKPFADITIQDEQLKTYGQPPTGQSAPYSIDQFALAQLALACMTTELTQTPTSLL